MACEFSTAYEMTGGFYQKDQVQIMPEIILERWHCNGLKIV